MSNELVMLEQYEELQEHIAYSVICYLDGVPGLYLNLAAIDAAREG